MDASIGCMFLGQWYDDLLCCGFVVSSLFANDRVDSPEILMSEEPCNHLPFEMVPSLPSHSNDNIYDLTITLTNIQPAGIIFA